MLNGVEPDSIQIYNDTLMGKPRLVGAVRELPLQRFVFYPSDCRYQQQRLLESGYSWLVSPLLLP
jgi:hypothetical protein